MVLVLELLEGVELVQMSLSMAAQSLAGVLVVVTLLQAEEVPGLALSAVTSAARVRLA
jgi:hypothetical protein